MSVFEAQWSVRRLSLYLFLFTLPSCESSGQKNLDQSDWNSRRTVPEYVTQALPTHPDTLAQTAHFHFFGYGKISQDLIDRITNRSEENLVEIENFTGRQLGNKRLHWYLYPNPEMKGLLLQNSSPNQVDFEKGEIRTIVNEVFSEHYLGHENELLLAELLGFIPEKHVFRVGGGIYFTQNWQKKGYQYWAAKLLSAGQLPSLEELFANENWEPASDLIFGCAAASFCRFLIEMHGKPFFLEKYQSGAFPPNEWQGLETGWRWYCAGFADPDPTPNLSSPLPYLKGFNFAHEGYRIYNGYGSGKAQQSLQHLKNMGSNAVAIVPYSFSRYPNKPHPVPVAKRAGSENDESVIQSAEDAQSLGLAVVLKPQIWVGRGLWTGDIAMESDDDWCLFFKHYGHWASHYAMLSEIYGWEMYCIGTELIQTTLNRESDWRGIVRSVRSLYGGPLIYAANWGDEFENLSLWNDLDYIGLNCYYPLSPKDDPSDRELKKSFDEVTRKIEQVHNRYNKPVIFTEIGFPCIKAPWKTPHNDWGDFIPDSTHQQRCYEIVFNGIHGKPWCNGILWWKYPSDLEHARRRNTGFSPHGAPAEGVVAKWFGRL